MQLRQANKRRGRSHCGMRDLSFERLEDRRLMAVTTSLLRGTLTVTGDGAADDIAIVGSATPGELIVTGRNGTVVNGIANGTAAVYPVLVVSSSGFVPDVALKVELAGGNDSVAIDNAYVGGSIYINTGEDNDTVVLGQSGEVSPTGDLSINTGAGNDIVAQLNNAVFVPGGNVIDLGDGHDIATIYGTSAGGRAWPYAFSIDALGVRGGNGNDSILVAGATTNLYTRIDGGLGANSLALLYSSGRGQIVTAQYDPDTSGFPGINTIYLDTNYSHTAINVGTYFPLSLSDGRDSSLTIVRCQAISMDIILGYGRNAVTLYGNTVIGSSYNANPTGEPIIIASALRVVAVTHNEPEASAASASVSMSYNVANQLFVTLTNGDDSLSLTGNVVRTHGSLDGRLGRNNVSEAYNYWASLSVQGFA
jgi:hypothetical protein